MAAAPSRLPDVAEAPSVPPKGRVGLGWMLILSAVALAVVVPVLDILQAPQAGPPVHGHEAATGAASIVHSPDAVAVAVELLVTLVVGLGLVVPRPLTSGRGFALVGGLSLLYADGLLHWFAILEHVGEPASMWFFAASGAVQIFAIPIALRWDRAAWWSGVALTVFFLVFYAATRLVPPPFSVEPEGVEGLGLLSKAAELGILGGMAGHFGGQIVPGTFRRPLQNRGVVELLLVGAMLTAAIGGVEALPIPVFLTAAVLLLVFMLSLSVAHRRESTLAAATAWVLAFSLVLGHLLYAAYYARLGLLAPLSLCILGAASLSAPALLGSITLRPPAPRAPLAG